MKVKIKKDGAIKNLPVWVANSLIERKEAEVVADKSKPKKEPKKEPEKEPEKGTKGDKKDLENKELKPEKQDK